MVKMEVDELKEMMLKILEERREISLEKRDFKNYMIKKFNLVLLSLQVVLNGYRILNKENEDN